MFLRYTVTLLVFYFLWGTILVQAQKNNDASATQQFTHSELLPTNGLNSVNSLVITNIRENGNQVNNTSINDEPLNGGLNSSESPNTSTADSSACPLLFVNVEFSHLNACSTSLVTLSYCNQGNRTATDAYVDLLLDSALSIQSSGLPYLAISSNIYRFNLDSITAGFCGNIQFNVLVACDTSLKGDEHCIEAHIMPDTTCEAVASLPILSLEGKCKGPIIEFLVHNGGLAVTSLQQIKFIIIDDHLLIQGNPTILQQGLLNIPAYASVVFNIQNVNASAYRIELRDSLDQLIATSSVSNCNSNHHNLLIQQHYFHSFWNGSPLPFKDTKCMINGSYVSHSAVSNVNEWFGINSIDTEKSINVTVENVPEGLASVRFMPNPFLQTTVLEVAAELGTKWQLQLFNNTGQLVVNRYVSSSNKFVLSASSLGGSGIYFYQIIQAGKTLACGKLVLQ